MKSPAGPGPDLIGAWPQPASSQSCPPGPTGDDPRPPEEEEKVMTSLPADPPGVIVGVDTHQDVHVAVALDALGRRLGELQIAATTSGYGQLVRWVRELDPAGSPPRQPGRGGADSGAARRRSCRCPRRRTARCWPARRPGSRRPAMTRWRWSGCDLGDLIEHVVAGTPAGRRERDLADGPTEGRRTPARNRADDRAPFVAGLPSRSWCAQCT